ncbi:MAG: signal recognition particle-docking protein FtsY [Kiritimatiellae bacterium]|nr:signal recognition particle-docking protein FtsY [Kiritimatiellia bacterium]
MAGWLEALRLTRRTLGGLFRGSGTASRAASLEELEEQLIRADVAPALAADWIKTVGRAESVKERQTLLREAMLQSLSAEEGFNWDPVDKPQVVLLVGVNGSGKTTTCAKLGFQANSRKHRALLAGADTFRAAGTDQLRIWAERLGCEIVAGKQGADAAAVAYDATEAALQRGYDYLFIDTAGRMHTKQPLMTELQKVRRSIAKVKADAPQEVWMVLDASLGRNAIAQARVFHEAVHLTGVVVTKMDGSSRGGFVFSIFQELGIPLRLIGLGEQENDLEPFSKVQFVEALLNQDEPSE